MITIYEEKPTKCTCQIVLENDIKSGIELTRKYPKFYKGFISLSRCVNSENFTTQGPFFVKMSEK